MAVFDAACVGGVRGGSNQEIGIASARRKALVSWFGDFPTAAFENPAKFQHRAGAKIAARTEDSPSVQRWNSTMTTRIIGTLLLLVGGARAEAAMITWEWAGPVTGYQCAFGPCSIDSVVPLGSPVKVSMTFNPIVPTPPVPSTPCYKGTASVSLNVLGQTYTNTGHVWDEAHGFGPGICVPGYNFVEVVVPGWGSGGPALPGGWVPFGFGLDGLWWGGDLTSVQPNAIGTQLPEFYRPQQSSPQRFTASLQAVPNAVPVPEPATFFLLSTGLSAAAWWRRRQ